METVYICYFFIERTRRTQADRSSFEDDQADVDCLKLNLQTRYIWYFAYYKVEEEVSKQKLFYLTMLRQTKTACH